MPNQTFRVELTMNIQINRMQCTTKASMVALKTAFALDGSDENKQPISIAAIAAK